MEVLGWVGTALVSVAYVPQIHHLFVERCAWGLSISTWLIWLLASTLLHTYCMLRRDHLFIIVQGINITATRPTIILARRSNHICPRHLRMLRQGREKTRAHR